MLFLLQSLQAVGSPDNTRQIDLMRNSFKYPPSRKLGIVHGEMLRYFESTPESSRLGSKLILGVSDAHAKLLKAMEKLSLFSISKSPSKESTGHFRTGL